MSPPRRPPEGARWNIPNWNPFESEEQEKLRPYLDQLEDLRQKLAAAEKRVEEEKETTRSLRAELNQKIADENLIANASETYAAKLKLEERVKARQIKIDELEKENDTLFAEVKRLKAIINPPRPNFRSRLIKFRSRYRGDRQFRESVHKTVGVAVIAVYGYMLIASIAIQIFDKDRPCFRSGGSFVHCGLVRGVWRPVIAFSRWTVGLENGDAEADTLGNEAAPASTTASLSGAESSRAETPASPPPPPAPEPVPTPAYVPPPPRVIDPNDVVKDLADKARSIASELGWSDEQAACARRETIDEMRTVFFQSYVREDRERTYDEAKSFLETAATRCNSAGRDAFMNRMIYDDDNYVRKLQARIAAGEFGDVWPTR